MNKNVIYWTLAVLITLSAAIYQRKTGPTHPKKIEYSINGNEYSTKFQRSENTGTDNKIEIEMPDQAILGFVHFKRFMVDEKWVMIDMKREENSLIAYLPHQPAAGKLEYFITLAKGEEAIELSYEEPIVIRWKGAVPGIYLIPHVIFMFFAMLLSNLTGILGFFKDDRVRKFTFISAGLLFAGGMILGPIVQLYAFGDLWTGVPFGWDLTDNKTLVAVIGFGVAVWANRKEPKPVYSIIAAIILLIIYSIPHSVMGSAYNYESGEVVTGMINLF